MKRLPVLLVALVLLLPSPASAQVSKFVGDWLNADPNTGGIVSLHITLSPEGIVVEGKGKCHPSNCTIPPMGGTWFGPRDGDVDEVTTVWERPNSQGKSNSEIWILRLADATEDKFLKLEVLSRWDSRSGRRFTYYFRRANEGEK